jgi:hypothetical protein
MIVEIRVVNMFRIVTPLLWIASLVAAAANALCGEGWPTTGHDNRRTGVTAEHLAPPLHLRWVFRSPAPPAPGWPPPANGYGVHDLDLTLDDTVVCDGRVGVACMVKDGVVIVHGTGSLGHPHREFLAGEFARRALYALASDDGRFLWGGRRGYRKRPIIVGQQVFAEPFAWDRGTRLRCLAAGPARLEGF